MTRDLDAVEKLIEELRARYPKDVCLIVKEALQFEQEKIHVQQPHGLVDQILEMVTKQIQKKDRN